ncbi:MAG: PAS domain-containing protein, partial [Chitinophagaceae bacterium]|nr:PAS domain-containing protein [Chitinophagaceae bacterium]
MKPILENSYSSFYPDLKEDPDRLQFAMMAAGVGIWELDPVSNQVLWDDRCRELFGLAKENKIEFDKAIKFIHPDDLDGVLAAVSSALKGENGGRYDMRYRTIGADDGKLRWVHFSGQAYFDHDGNPTKFGGIAQDITDYTETLLRSERALQESEERFRTVVSSAPAGIALFVGRDLIIEMPNQAIIDIIGKGPDIA